jgi:hypothetical protein
VVVLYNRMTSGHLVVRLIFVKRWVKHFEAGSGPTRSTWMWLNLRAGMGMC